MNALAMLAEFFAFFVELFKKILTGFTGIFGGDEADADVAE